MDGWEIAFEVARLGLAAGIGFGSAQLALHFDQRRAERLADADWDVTPIPKEVAIRGRIRAWVVKNTGTKTARNVEFDGLGVTLIRDPAASDVFRPGESEMIIVKNSSDASLKLRIRWTSHRGEDRETTRLLEITY